MDCCVWPFSDTYLWTLLGGGSKVQEKKSGEGAIAVEAKEVSKGLIVDSRLFSGTVLSDAEFTVSAKISGSVKQIYFNIGDEVKLNDLIAELDDEEYQLDLEIAGAELDVAKAKLEESKSNLEIKKRDLERAQLLSERKVLSEADLDKALMEYRSKEAANKVCEAEAKLKKAAYDSSNVKLGYTMIHALWSEGKDKRYIGERFINEGDLLQANDPLVRLVDLDSMKVQINVIEKDIPKIFSGQKTLIRTDAYPGRIFEGNVFRISPIVMEKSRLCTVEIRVGNNEHLLKPGMFAIVELEFGRNENATLVPVQAIARRGDLTGVFLVGEKDATARYVPVKTGTSNKEFVEICDPPISGLVVTLGHHLLESGTKTIISNEKTRPKK